MAHRNMAATNALRTEGTPPHRGGPSSVPAVPTQSMVLGYGYANGAAGCRPRPTASGRPAAAGSRRHGRDAVERGTDRDGSRRERPRCDAACSTARPGQRHPGGRAPQAPPAGGAALRGPLVYVDDAAMAMVAALERGEPGTPTTSPTANPSASPPSRPLSPRPSGLQTAGRSGWLLMAAPYARAVAAGALRFSGARAVTELGWCRSAHLPRGRRPPGPSLPGPANRVWHGSCVA